MDKPVFVGELIADGKKRRVRDLFAPDAAPVALAGGQPRAVMRARSGSIVRVVREEDGWRAREILAAHGTPLERMYRIAGAEALDPVFPPAVEAEVAHLLAAPGIDDGALEDMTSLPFVTIDGPGTRDLDQAVFIESDGPGAWQVLYALADASHSVRPGTALFGEALRRGASFYLPGLCIPMLPPALSEGIVSLNEKVERRAVVFRMRVDRGGRCTKTSIHRARIKSRAKLTFEDVRRFLDDGAPLPDRSAEASVALVREVGLARVREAEQRDVVRHRRSEVEVSMERGERRDGSGMRFVMDLAMRGEVEAYNEQLSLLCNIEGARFLRLGDQPTDHVHPIYRVHPTPSDARYRELETLLDAIVRRHDLPASWRWRRGTQSLADYLRALPEGGPHARVAKAVQRQAVLANARSVFSEEPANHHGVGAEVYARFSAPMREIVGVFLHKEAFEKLHGPAATVAGVPSDDMVREKIVTRSNDAKRVQKRITDAANRAVLDELFEVDCGLPRAERPRRLGTVMGLAEGKAHILLDEPAIEVKVYSRHEERRRNTRIKLDDDAAAWLCPTTSATRTTSATQWREICRVGDEVGIVVHDRDRGPDRWMLGMSGAREEE